MERLFGTLFLSCKGDVGLCYMLMNMMCYFFSEKQDVIIR
jgi:hypothetical protein